MKIKYRIKEYSHPFARNFFVAQYRIFGLWMNICIMQIGRFTKPASTICETLEEAKKRVEIHKLNMKRASDFMDRSSAVVWKD